MWQCICRRDRWGLSLGCLVRLNIVVFVAAVQAPARQVLCAKKFSSTCPCVVTMKPIVVMRKQENMPRE